MKEHTNVSMNQLLSRDETILMRGVAIFFIMIHNFLHLLLPVKENEFVYNPANFRLFIEHIKNQPEWIWADVFSFLGWYGVVVFIFLSAYGLSMKYESLSTGNESTCHFIIRHWKKTVKLMLLPMILYAVLVSIARSQLFSLKKLFLQLSLVSNFTFPELIEPGVFWFFGLIFQLYVVYRLLIYRRSSLFLLSLSVLSIGIIILYAALNRSTSMLMHNFIGWMLPFSLGIIVSRYDISCFIDKSWKCYLILISGLFFLILMNANIYTWTLSPLIAVGVSVSFVKILKSSSIIKMLGELSAFIFVIHPIVRLIMQSNYMKALFRVNDSLPYTMSLVTYTVVFVILSIIGAKLYSMLLDIRLLKHNE